MPRRSQPTSWPRRATTSSAVAFWRALLSERNCTLKDGVTIIVNDLTINALYAGPSGAAVGVDAVRFQVPATLPDSPFLPVKIRINCQESNTVLLRILC